MAYWFSHIFGHERHTRRTKAPKEKMRTLDKVLIIVGSFVGAFIIATVIIYTANGWPYDVLIPCVVGSGILETVNTMLITVNKIKRGKDAGDSTDDSGSIFAAGDAGCLDR